MVKRAVAWVLFLAVLAGGTAMRFRPVSASEPIRLPEPRMEGGAALSEVLAARRSVREYGSRALSLGEVSHLLWAAQGVTGEDGERAAPSAGALYPLELQLVVRRVEGLEPGLYRYRPRRHELTRVASAPSAAALVRAAWEQEWIAGAPLVIAVAAVESRTARKYGDRAPRYVAMEVGCVAENVYLQATALGLGTTFVGAFDDGKTKTALALGANEEPLALLPVGALP
jgi:SagB-type dehydrogenase family enzyme